MCATRQVCGRRHYFHVAPFRTHLLLFLKQKRYEFNIVDLIGYLDIEEKVRAKMLMAIRLRGVLASMWCKKKSCHTSHNHKKNKQEIKQEDNNHI